MPSFGSKRLSNERLVFLLSAAWLLWAGLRFQDAPEVHEWGPPRTFEMPPAHTPVRVDQVHIDIDELIEGEAFRAEQDPQVDGSREADEMAEAAEAEVVVVAEVAAEVVVDRRLPTPPPPSDRGRLRDVGRICVGDADLYAFLEAKEGGGYIGVRESDPLPGRGLTVVKVTKAYLVVEDGHGRRFRLPGAVGARPLLRPPSVDARPPLP